MRSITRNHRIAFTLVEVLVTMAIISAVTVLALPSIKESLRSTMLSQSTNLVTGSFLNARSMALRSGKPYGVIIRRKQVDITTGETNGTVKLGSSNIRLDGSNIGSRIEYVQAAGLNGLYPAAGNTAGYFFESGYFDLSTSNPGRLATALGSSVIASASPCNRIEAIFVPFENAELLYAAALGTNPSANLLIGVGCEVELEENADKKVRGTIRSLVAVNGSAGNQLRDYIEPTIDCQTGDAVADPTGTNLDVAGTIILLDDAYANQGRIKSSGPSFSYTSGYDLRIQMRPIKAPLTSVDLPGRVVIDLSVSGSRTQPTAFASQEIIGNGGLVFDQPDVSGSVTIADNSLIGIGIMFAPDGRVESIYRETLGAGGYFQYQRFEPPPNLSFLIGYSNAIASENLDDIARYQIQWSSIAGRNVTFPSPTMDDVPEYDAIGAPDEEAWNPRVVPNFANPDCRWATLMTATGAVRVDSVAPPNPSLFTTSLPAGTYTAREITRLRIEDSKRIIFGGNQ
jgi:Tfp pilus assembly protein FimT